MEHFSSTVRTQSLFVKKRSVCNHIDSSPSCIFKLTLDLGVASLRSSLLMQSIVGIFGSSIILHIGMYSFRIVAILVCIAFPTMSHHAGAVMSQGRVVFEYAQMCIGEEAMSHIVQSGQKLRLPMGFWPACCRHCLHRVCTGALRKSLSKALYFYIRSLRKGATTTCGMLVEKKGGTEFGARAAAE